MKQEHICVGKIYREHGIEGRVKVYLYSGAAENFRKGSKIVIKKNSGETLSAKILDVAPFQRWFLTRFSVFASPEEAREWRKAFLYVPKDRLKPLAKGEAYVFELVGFGIFDSDENFLGNVVAVRESGESALFVVSRGKKEILIPVVPKWIVSVDRKNKKIVINVPEGLVD